MLVQILNRGKQQQLQQIIFSDILFVKKHLCIWHTLMAGAMNSFQTPASSPYLSAVTTLSGQSGFGITLPASQLDKGGTWVPLNF